MLMFTKISIEATIINTDNILMDQALHMAGQTVPVLQARLEGESAELVINATSSGRNAMDRHLVLTVERKKRGKASRKDLAQQAAAAAANGQKSPTSHTSEERSPTESRNESSSTTNESTNDFKRPQAQRSLSLNTTGLDSGSAREALKGRLRAGSLESLSEMPNGHQPHMYQQHVTQNYTTTLRYPVLEPLIPHLGNIIPLSLACDLLDLYFASASSALMHPTSPYVLGYVFRKHSILHPTKPRQCTPALLASMLWVVAQTSDATFLTAPPSSRGRICERLLDLTVGLLKPLIHGHSAGDTSPNFSNTVVNGVALGGLGVAMPGSVESDGLNRETSAFGAAGTLDDVVTYIHLATVVSASEYKGASLRWWNAAWSLARELKLGRELPTNQDSPRTATEGGEDVDADGEADDHSNNAAGITEEEREERRRIWWLVYTVDRHLALCYNRPLFLLDIECDGLLQPMDDTLWQAGEFYTGDSSIHITSPNGSARIRRRGPNYEVSGNSIFGYFLPLMTILGEIVDLYHAKNHPRFGVGFRSSQEWDDYASEIARQLDAYGQSLKDFELRHLGPQSEEHMAEAKMDGVSSTNQEHNDIGTPSVHSVHTASSAHISETEIQTRIMLAYGTHVMHVLHILLTGKWDPIKAINNILEYDPGLEFMPFFFGVYLLQGSFLLLLIADKLQVEASPSVVKACETIRNFRKVMRSALAQVRGRIPEDFGEQQLRRREVLALYRWTGDGTGLAL
ncbi:putative xylanolytic transcriptional activator xlnR [Glarea lozoyensis 74030]|uniref:Putative xylanolytic transcriptional activator xlnR n=1 Tax=Glarea lozoyensis (strain ATCC 74030 / MF5533) TaxID=1104152 RepID=H0EIW1_GLAL7|nr:putative xylanolytic transcriptional activator xlnR [Glarea lozoyensis 74030]